MWEWNVKSKQGVRKRPNLILSFRDLLFTGCFKKTSLILLENEIDQWENGKKNLPTFFCKLYRVLQILVKRFLFFSRCEWKINKICFYFNKLYRMLQILVKRFILLKVRVKSNKICFCILISYTSNFGEVFLILLKVRMKINKICFYPFISCTGCFKFW